MFLLERHIYYASSISLACVCFIAANIEFTARQNEYFTIDSTKVNARSSIECSTGCGQNDSCQSVNYNQETFECEVLTLQPTDGEVEPKQDWTLYTRTIDMSAAYERSWVSFNNSLYVYVDLKKTWDDADSFCKSMNAELADIHSTEEKSFLNSIMDSGWIGLKRNTSGTGYVWSSGKSYTYRISALVNSPGCIFSFYSPGADFWMEGNCTSLDSFTCEKPIV